MARISNQVFTSGCGIVVNLENDPASGSGARACCVCGNQSNLWVSHLSADHISFPV